MFNRLLIGSAILVSLTACEQMQQAFNKNAAEPKPPASAQDTRAAAQQAYREAYQWAQSGNTARELEVLSAANARDPNDPYLMRPLGYALLDNGRPEEAVTVFDSLIAQDQRNARYYADKAVALDYVGQHTQAQDLYRQALALAPDNAGFKNNLGMSLILSGRYDDAIAVLEPLCGQPGATRKMRQNLALAYGLKGNVEKALVLDRKDLTPEQARDNGLFYEEYAVSRKTGDAQSAKRKRKQADDVIDLFEGSPMNAGDDKSDN